MELSSSPEVFSNIGCVVYVTYITETLPGFTEWGRNFMSGLNHTTRLRFRKEKYVAQFRA